MHGLFQCARWERGRWAALALFALGLLSCKGSHAGQGEKPASSETPATAAPSLAEPQPSQPAAPPPIAARSLILQPSFVAASGPFAAGKAVPVRAAAAPNGVVVLSCHHIFGPSGGLPAQLEASALPGFIKKASVADLDGKTFELGPALVVPHAKEFTLPDAGGDVSVFQAPKELAARALDLAPGLPQAGERVWLMASLEGRTELLQPANVTGAADKIVVYQFDSADLDLNGTSGGPVVNAQGQLVALNLGGGPMQGVLRAFGIPVPSLRRALTAALGSQ
jgi:hypothetical protein